MFSFYNKNNNKNTDRNNNKQLRMLPKLLNLFIFNIFPNQVTDSKNPKALQTQSLLTKTRADPSAQINWIKWINLSSLLGTDRLMCYGISWVLSLTLPDHVHIMSVYYVNGQDTDFL